MKKGMVAHPLCQNLRRLSGYFFFLAVVFFAAVDFAAVFLTIFFVVFLAVAIVPILLSKESLAQDIEVILLLYPSDNHTRYAGI
jgi:hypothetical protein